MSKKASNWVTIPEETLHTPVSTTSQASKKTDETVKHKAAWGVGFVVMVVAAFAVLAPQEFASILQGNLFDTADTPEQAVTQDIEPLNVLPTEATPEETAEVVGETTSTAESTPAVSQVVQPESEAVSVQVEPVSTAETITVEPVTTETPAPTQETANERLLRELAEQVEAIQERDQQSQQVVQDIATQVQEQIEDLRGVATEIATQPTSVIPPLVQTIVSTPQATTGYRPNPYKVTITPQQALANNQTLQAQALATRPTQVAVAQAQPLTGQLSRATTTPESGPQETLLMALGLAFLAGLTWKAKNTFSA